MRIKEVVKRTGLTEKTIRYYESCGLVVPDMEMKDHRFWRDYSESHARLLSAVATLRRASFRVEEIALLLSKPEKIPETVEKVRERAAADRAEAEKLCELLARPALGEAADVLALARQLGDGASRLALPPTDQNYRYRGRDRAVRPPRSLAGALAVRFGLLVCLLWLLAMALLTCVFAGELGRQAARTGENALEAFFAAPDPEAASVLPELGFHPDGGFLIPKNVVFPLQKAVLVLDERGIVIGSRGFRLPDPASVETVKELVSKRAQPVYNLLGNYMGQDFELVPDELGLGVREGQLCLLAPPVSNENQRPSRFSLAFRDAPKLGVSFPCHEIQGDYPEEEKTYAWGVPVRPGAVEQGQQRDWGIFAPSEPALDPPLELLDGIDGGALHFDGDGILQGSRLRGAWLRDEEGQTVCFLLAACGWSPLTMAFRLLSGIYPLSLALFLLLGLLLWLGLRRNLVRPLEAWNAGLGDALPGISPEEFDYGFRYRELRELASRGLLRRQMLAAAALTSSGERTTLGPALDTALRKLGPLLLDRGLKARTELSAEGAAACGEARLQESLLALIREAVPYADHDSEFLLRVTEREGFLLAEAEVWTKWFLRAGAYAALWEGVYRLPGGEAPGARLRRASSAIPGSFCAVRKTRHGLVLILGLPQGSEPAAK